MGMLKPRGRDALQPEHPFDWLKAVAAVASMSVLLTGAFVVGRVTAPGPDVVPPPVAHPPTEVPAEVPDVMPVVRVAPPVPSAPVPAKAPVAPGNPDPDWLNEPGALERLMERIHEATDHTGRFKFLNISADRTVVALVEVGPGELDSVAISWGHTIRQPIAMDDEERAALEDQLFTLTVADLEDIPETIAELEVMGKAGTRVGEVRIHGIATDPHIEYHLEHPRNVLEPVHVTLQHRQR